MLLRQLRGLAALQPLHSAQCAPSLSRRWLSTTTASDEFNREMAEFFGTAAQPEPPASGAGQPATPREHGGPAPADVESLNAELLGFFGAPRQGAAEGGTAASLPQQLAALAGQPGAAAAQLTGSGGRSRSSGPSGAAASGHGSEGAGGPGLTHVDPSGKAAMVDVSEKPATVRTATAAARVLLGREVFDLVARNQMKKGDVLTVAQLAGVMGAKHTALLVPLCHNIPLSKVRVSLALAPADAAVDVTASAACVGPTGVEMEALTAAAVAALCVYDMCKAASKGIVVTDLRLLSKSGGRSGEWAAAR